MKELKFREHRGSLSESMNTIRSVSSKKDIAEICNNKFITFEAEKIEITPYCYDARIRWDTHIVTYQGYVVLGFTDGNIHGNPELVEVVNNGN